MPLDLVLEDGEKKDLKNEQLDDIDAGTPNSSTSPKVSNKIHWFEGIQNLKWSLDMAFSYVQHFINDY